MLKLVLNRSSVLACLADCPVPSAKATGTTTDNHTRQLAQFLYETLCTIKTPMRIIFIIFLSVSSFNCSSQTTSREMKNHFSTEQISDLNKIIDFFKSQICADTQLTDFKSCFENLPHLVDNGYSPIFERVDFTNQKELYKSISKNTFDEIWMFCPTKNYLTDTEYESLCAAGFGKKYSNFLTEIGMKNKSVADYADRLIESGDFGFTLYFPQQVYSNQTDFDLTDINIQVLLSIHFLSINDQFNRNYNDF